MNVAVNVHIRRNADGVVRVYPFPEYGWDDDPDGASEFMWSDGNYGCDCNRSLFFARSVGEDDDPNRVCGDTAFSVRIFDLAGNVVYHDDDF